MASEVDLRINAASQIQMENWEAKLTEHQEAMEERFSETKNAVQENVGRTIALAVDVAVIKSDTSRQTVLLESMERNSANWHEADITFRENVIERVTSIEDEAKQHGEILKRIHWVIATSVGVGKTFRLILRLVCTTEFWQMFGFAIMFFILSKLWPSALHIFKHIFER